tara:strand:+ start:336 stop:626 length:291 start_codon:yes stop_codon:yes gene_type:complete
MTEIEQKRTQNGQDFRRPNWNEIYVGQCVWINTYDPNVGRSWLEGPYFVTETIHKGRMSEYFVLFSTHQNSTRHGRHSDIWVPIIDAISPPKGHNA